MSDEEKKVIAFPQKGGTPADDPLRRLPEITEADLTCRNCGKHFDDVKTKPSFGWTMSRFGCVDCLPPTVQQAVEEHSRAVSAWCSLVNAHLVLLAASRDVIAGKAGAVSSLRRVVHALDENDRISHERNMEALAVREAYLAAERQSDPGGKTEP